MSTILCLYYVTLNLLQSLINEGMLKQVQYDIVLIVTLT